MNDRWIVADFAFTAATLQNGPYFECIAVSKTSDPVSGGWWLFAYRGDDAAHPWFPDYPKMGIWPDGLYMTANIRYAGRLFTDPLNTLPQTEVTMLPGITRGNQTGNCGGGVCQRWGDYSAMSIDPTDECTFWYTQEYYETSGTNWLTRIGSFKFPTCILAPTAAKVNSFTADGFDDGRVLLQWSSGHEIDNLGYNVYREAGGRRTKINPQIIAGSALVTGPSVALSAGMSYAWADELRQDTVYWFELQCGST